MVICKPKVCLWVNWLLDGHQLLTLFVQKKSFFINFAKVLIGVC